MYLFEDVNETWREYARCRVCGFIYPSWKSLSKHVGQQPNTHPNLEEYKRLYFPLGYLDGTPPKNKCLYVICDPEFPGDFEYETNLFGNTETLLFNFKPIYVGFGKMGKNARHKYNTGRDCNEDLHNRSLELTFRNLRPITYIVKENLTSQQGKEGEKILIPLIGIQNNPDPNLRGILLNRNFGGDGVIRHTQETREQMGITRRGNRNRCDRWKLTRLLDGYVVITTNLRQTCEELGLNINCIHQITAGKQKTHRGWTAENLTRRIAVGGTC